MNDDDNNDPVQPDPNGRWMESVTLWPDPWLAPDVPPPFVFAGYVHDRLAHLEGPIDAALLAALTTQIETSENCALALGAYQFEDEDGRPLTAPEIAKLRELLEIDDYMPSGSEKARATPAFEAEASKPGAIFRTRRRVKRGVKLEDRWTFAPRAVIITTPHIEGEAGLTTLVRGVVCTPLVVHGDVSDDHDEIVVKDARGNFWVAHLWLEFPISLEQLGTPLSRVIEEEMDQLQSRMDALAQETDAPPPMLTPAKKVARARLHDEASWLASTAYAYLAKWEAEAERKEEERDPFDRTMPFEVLPGPRENWPMAAGGEDEEMRLESTVDLMVVALSVSAFKAGAPLPAGEYGRALHKGEDGAREVHGKETPVSWRLVFEGETSLQRGLLFAVVDRRAGPASICATGRLESAEKATVTVPGESSLTEYWDRPDDFALLIFAP